MWNTLSKCQNLEPVLWSASLLLPESSLCHWNISLVGWKYEITSKLSQHTANIPMGTTLLLQHFAVQGLSTSISTSNISPSFPMIGKSLKYSPVYYSTAQRKHICVTHMKKQIIIFASPSGSVLFKISKGPNGIQEYKYYRIRFAWKIPTQQWQ